MRRFAFEQWCDQLQLPTATRDFLLSLGSSPPARHVQGCLLNVCETYTSRKMGVSIQFESHAVESWAIYIMEYNQAVLEYFDQPCQLELRYQGPSGRATKALHIPDFLILCPDGASFEEWKPEGNLLELMGTHLGRYKRDDDGKWHWPPGEEAAERMDSSTACDPMQNYIQHIHIRNLIFLEDYLFECPVSHIALMQVLETVKTSPGITFANLREQHPHLHKDDVYPLIASNRLYVDLFSILLENQRHIPLYLDQPTTETYALLQTHQSNVSFGQRDGAHVATFHANASLDWNGKRWTLLSLGDTTTTLLPEEGTVIQLEAQMFLHLVETNAIQVKDTSGLPVTALSTEVHHFLLKAGDEAIGVANKRYRLVEAYQNKQREVYVCTSTRTIRDWLTHFCDAEAAYGCGYVGFCKQGNLKESFVVITPHSPRKS